MLWSVFMFKVCNRSSFGINLASCTIEDARELIARGQDAQACARLKGLFPGSLANEKGQELLKIALEKGCSGLCVLSIIEKGAEVSLELLEFAIKNLCNSDVLMALIEKVLCTEVDKPALKAILNEAINLDYRIDVLRFLWNKGGELSRKNLRLKLEAALERGSEESTVFFLLEKKAPVLRKFPVIAHANGFSKMLVDILDENLKPNGDVV